MDIPSGARAANMQSGAPESGDANKAAPEGTSAGWTDDAYFGGYSNISIHESMLKDATRTNAYRQAVMSNAELFAGKTVLDVGCGTGILSIFAAQAGAARVYAVDASVMADHAEAIVKHNKLDHIIQVIKAKVEDMTLPTKVDIVISEWMGYFLLFEGMLETVLDARDRFMKPGGLMFPSTANLFLAPYNDDITYEDKVGFFRNVYGIDMSPIMPLAEYCAFPKYYHVQKSIDPSQVLAPPVCVASLDLTTCTVDDLQQQRTSFQFRSSRPAGLYGFVSWFDVGFPGRAPVTLTTDPMIGYTHWMHTVFYTEHKSFLEPGQLISGEIEYRKHPTDTRSYNVWITHSTGKTPMFKEAWTVGGWYSDATALQEGEDGDPNKAPTANGTSTSAAPHTEQQAPVQVPTPMTVTPDLPLPGGNPAFGAGGGGGGGYGVPATGQLAQPPAYGFPAGQPAMMMGPPHQGPPPHLANENGGGMFAGSNGHRPSYNGVPHNPQRVVS